MTDFAPLEIKVSESGTTVATNRLDGLADAGGRAEVAAGKLAKGSKVAANGVSDAGKSAKSASINMRILTPQLSQIGQQFTATGQLGQAIAVQAADIGLAFGTIGTIVGTLAGVALPTLMSSFGGVSSAARDFDNSIDDLGDAIANYASFADIAKMSTSEMSSKFGGASSQMRTVLGVLEEIAKSEAQRALDGVADAISEIMGVAGDGDLRAAIADTFDANIFLAFNQEQRDARDIARGLTGEFLASQEALSRAAGSAKDQSAILADMLNTAISLADLDGKRSEKEEAIVKRVAEAAKIAEERLSVERDIDQAKKSQLITQIESIGKAAESVSQYERQAELSNAIAQYGKDSAEVEAVKRSHAASSVEEYIRQNNLSGQVAQSLRDSAMAAYDADVNAAAAANSLSQAEAAARGMAAALAQAAGFSANLDATVATLEKEISLLKSGADQALASQVAALEVKAESAAADVLLATGSKELSEIAALGYEAQIGKIKELSEAKANEIKITKAQGKAASATGKKIKKAMSEAEKAAEKYADTMNGYVVDAIVNVSDSFFDFLGRGFKDFKSFAGSILDGFKNMLLNMIKMAAQNKIMISMGLGGSVLGGAASAATGGGGILGSVAGSIGGVLGVGGAGLAGLAGSGGIMGGIGSIASGLGGVLSGGGLGASFANLGGLLSGSIGGLGALGAAIPAIGIIAVGLSAIIGKTKKVDEGLRITVRSITDSVGEVEDVAPSTTSGGLFSKILGGLHGGTEKIFTEFGDGLEASVEAYVKTQTSRLFGAFKSNKTRYQNASEEITGSIVSGLESIQTSIIAYAGYLGVGLDTFDDFYAQLNVSLKGLSEDEKLAAIEEALTEIGDEFAGMIEGLSEFSQEGEGATATLERLVNSVSNVNQWWDRLGFGLEELSLSGGAAASAIVDLYGDLETFTSLTGEYYNNFYSQQERTAQAIQEVTSALEDIGVDGLPASRDAFRELVEAAEAAGDDQLVADLIAISGAFAEITAESNALASSLDASMFATRAAFEFAQAQIASGGSSVDYESADTALLRELVTYVREGNIVLAQNTADTARELMRQNLNAEGE